MVEAFLRAIDDAWEPNGSEPVQLRILGSTALFLQTDYRRGTKDADVLEAADLPPAARQQLLALAGPGAELHKRHRLYIDIVAKGIPFLAEEPLWLPADGLERSLVNFGLETLDVVDVVVAKLWRYHAQDRDDVEAMIAKGLVPHEILLEVFRSAVANMWLSARADELPRVVANLNRIERDSLGVRESVIELPPGVEDCRRLKRRLREFEVQPRSGGGSRCQSAPQWGHCRALDVRRGLPHSGHGGPGTSAPGRPSCTTQILAHRSEQPVSAISSSIAIMCRPCRMSSCKRASVAGERSAKRGM